MSDDEEPTEGDTDEDLRAFREAVSDVRPLGDDGRVRYRRRPAARPRFSEAETRSVLDEALSGFDESLAPEAGEGLLYRRPGLDASSFRRLRRGLFPIGRELDLHGLSADAAARLTQETVRAAYADGVRCIRLIHGKGHRSTRGPVLKGMLGRLLPRLDEVLAFVSARPEDGGSGAVYVLLRKQ